MSSTSVNASIIFHNNTINTKYRLFDIYSNATSGSVSIENNTINIEANSSTNNQFLSGNSNLQYYLYHNTFKSSRAVPLINDDTCKILDVRFNIFDTGMVSIPSGVEAVSIILDNYFKAKPSSPKAESDYSFSHSQQFTHNAYNHFVNRTNFTITYELNGGSFKDGYTPVTSYNYDSGVITLPEFTNLTYPDKIFKGWYTNPSFSGDAVYSFNHNEYKDMTFYAKWDEDISLNYTILEREMETILSLQPTIIVSTMNPLPAGRINFTDGQHSVIYKSGETHFNTISAAINQANNLEGVVKIFVLHGTFNEEITINRNDVEIYGSYYGKVYDSVDRSTTATDETVINNNITINAFGVAISGFKFGNIRINNINEDATLPSVPKIDSYQYNYYKYSESSWDNALIKYSKLNYENLTFNFNYNYTEDIEGTVRALSIIKFEDAYGPKYLNFNNNKIIANYSIGYPVIVANKLAGTYYHTINNNYISWGHNIYNAGWKCSYDTSSPVANINLEFNNNNINSGSSSVIVIKNLPNTTNNKTCNQFAINIKNNILYSTNEKTFTISTLIDNNYNYLNGKVYISDNDFTAEKPALCFTYGEEIQFKGTVKRIEISGNYYQFTNVDNYSNKNKYMVIHLSDTAIEDTPNFPAA